MSLPTPEQDAAMLAWRIAIRNARATADQAADAAFIASQNASEDVLEAARQAYIATLCNPTA